MNKKIIATNRSFMEAEKRHASHLNTFVELSKVASFVPRMSQKLLLKKTPNYVLLMADYEVYKPQVIAVITGADKSWLDFFRAQDKGKTLLHKFIENKWFTVSDVELLVSKGHPYDFEAYKALAPTLYKDIKVFDFLPSPKTQKQSFICRLLERAKRR